MVIIFVLVFSLKFVVALVKDQDVTCISWVLSKQTHPMYLTGKGINLRVFFFPHPKDLDSEVLKHETVSVLHPVLHSTPRKEGGK